MSYILDTDIGVDPDDIIALDLCLRNNLPLLAVTTCFRNTLTKAKIAKIFLNSHRHQVPVHYGKNSPRAGLDWTLKLGFPETLGELDGNETLEVYPGATDFILNASKKEKITLLCIGPLTTIAECIRQDKNFASRVKAAYIMGGVFDRKALGMPWPENNFGSDPDAARTVLGAKMKSYLLPADITWKVLIGPDKIKAIIERDKSKLISIEINRWREFHKIKMLKMHDPLTVAAAIDPGLCHFEYQRFDLNDTGEIILKADGKLEAEVCTGFEKRFFEML